MKMNDDLAEALCYAAFKGWTVSEGRIRHGEREVSPSSQEEAAEAFAAWEGCTKDEMMARMAKPPLDHGTLRWVVAALEVFKAEVDLTAPVREARVVQAAVSALGEALDRVIVDLQEG